MGKVTIQNETTLNPISLIGKEAGICWGSDVENPSKNYSRGIECLSSGHGRTWEYPQVYIIIDGYSARVIRELYSHIGGSPTRLQASSRYINYSKGFEYVIPPKIENNAAAAQIYTDTMKCISENMVKLEELGIPGEDVSMILPLGMETKIVLRTNLRNLIDMSHQRLCNRAYWEYRNLMKDIISALSVYSPEWEYIAQHYFVPKCKLTGYCPEKKSCGLCQRRAGD